MLVEKFSLPSYFFERNIAGLIFVVKLFKRTEFFPRFSKWSAVECRLEAEEYFRRKLELLAYNIKEDDFMVDETLPVR